MKIKKMLSLFTAAAISASCFIGFAASAEAASASETNLTFTYSNIVIGEGGKTHDGGRADSYTLDEGVDAALAALYDTNSDNIIDSEYTCSYIDYIGKNVNVSINVSLEPGNYTIYYGGVSGTIASAYLSDNTALTIGSEIKLHTASGTVDQNKDMFMVIPITLVLTETYNGAITFANSGGWLPDLCSIKVVGSDFKTQDDVITAADIIRPARASKITALEGSSAASEACPEELTAIFGANFSKAGSQELSYTDSTGENIDYVYLNVTKAADYTVKVLGTNAKHQTLTFISGTEPAGTLTTDKSTSNIATIGTKKIYCMYTESKISLSPGVYKVTIERVGTETYYTNLVAFALTEVAAEPYPDPAISVTVEQASTSTDKDGSAAAAYTAAFSITGASETNSVIVNGCTWTVTNNDDSTKTETASSALGQKSTVTGDGSFTFGLVITGSIDKIGTVTAELN